MSGKALRAISSGLVVLALSLGTVPTVAMAEQSDQIRAELEQAQERLNGLYEQAEQASERLNEVRVDLDETNESIDLLDADIQKTESELAQAREDLSSTVSWAYKSRPTFLSLILSSSSVDELLSNVYYANKVSESQAQKIGRVYELMDQLDAQMADLQKVKADQEVLVAEQEARQEELDLAAGEAAQYVANLSQELQEALAAEEAARQEAMRRAAEEAAARAAAEEAARAAAEEAARAAAAEANVEYVPVSEAAGDVASIVVNTAYAELGKPYVWGAEGPSTFDCSGLVMWCYAAAGISVPHYSGDQAAYCNKPASAAVAGDIVWRQGHVGLCIGDGKVIEALPGAGVCFGTVYDFTLSGSPA